MFMSAPTFEMLSRYVDNCLDEAGNSALEEQLDLYENSCNDLELLIAMEDAIKKWWLTQIMPPTEDQPGYLYYYFEKQEKQKFSLPRHGGAVWIGRGNANHINIGDDPTISKKHVKIMYSKARNGHFRIKDTSSYGTNLIRDDKTLELKKNVWCPLIHGDWIILVPNEGRCSLWFQDPRHEEEIKEYAGDLSVASNSFIEQFFNQQGDHSKIINNPSQAEAAEASPAMRTMEFFYMDDATEERLPVEIYNPSLLQKLYDSLDSTQQTIYTLRMGGKSYQQIGVFFRKDSAFMGKYIAQIRYKLLQKLKKEIKAK